MPDCFERVQPGSAAAGRCGIYNYVTKTTARALRTLAASDLLPKTSYNLQGWLYATILEIKDLSDDDAVYIKCVGGMRGSRVRMRRACLPGQEPQAHQRPVCPRQLGLLS